MHHLPVESDRFDRPVPDVEDGRPRSFVYAPGLDPHVPVLDQIDPADPVDPPQHVEMREELRRSHLFPAYRHGDPPYVIDLHVGRLVRSLLGGAGKDEHVLGWLRRRIFEDPALEADVHEIPVARVRFPHRYGSRDAVFLRILHEVRPGPEIPLPPGRDDAYAGHERIVGEFEPDLIVPLAGRTVRYGVRLLLAGHLDLLLRDEGPGDGGPEEVRPLVHRVRHERGEDEIPDEFVLDVFHVHFRCTGLLRLGADGRELLPLAEIRHVGDHLAVVRLDQPPEDDRRVEPPGIREHDLLHFFHFFPLPTIHVG